MAYDEGSRSAIKMIQSVEFFFEIYRHLGASIGARMETRTVPKISFLYYEILHAAQRNILFLWGLRSGEQTHHW